MMKTEGSTEENENEEYWEKQLRMRRNVDGKAEK
jgi:hypothetical protein